MQQGLLVHPFMNLIREQTAALPDLACLPCEEAHIYICNNVTQVPFLKTVEPVFCLVIPLTCPLSFPGKDELRDCSRGELLALGQDQIPACLSAERTGTPCRDERLMLIFYMQPALDRVLQQMRVSPDAAAGCLQIQLLRVPELQKILEMLCECNEKKPGRAALLSCITQALLLQVLRQTVRLAPETACLAQSGMDRQLASVYRQMQTDCTENLTLRQLAEQAGWSVSHLIRTFRQQYGVTPGRMLIKLRIHQSMQLLDSSDLPVGEICMNCGFGSHSQFARLFRRETGLTPQQYRKCFR